MIFALLRPWIAALVLVSASSTAAGPAAADSPEKAAETAALAWLSVVDAGHYGQSWDDAAAAFRTAVTKEKWEAALDGVRKPLGKAQSRTLLGAKAMKDLPGAPPGDYVVLQFDTKFDARAAVETVTPMKEKDGSWKVSGYFIK